jgi:hypothetical protein
LGGAAARAKLKRLRQEFTSRGRTVIHSFLG